MPKLGNLVVYESCESVGTNCDVHQAAWNWTTWVVTNLTSTPNRSQNPDTDGTLVVSDATRGGERDIYWQPAGGGVEQRLELPGVQKHRSFRYRGGYLLVYQVATNRLFRVTSTPVDETLNDVSALPDNQFHLVWSDGGVGNRDVHGITIKVPTTPGGTYASAASAPRWNRCRR